MDAVELDGDIPEDQVAELIKLTERYCVELQTIAGTPEISVDALTSAG